MTIGHKHQAYSAQKLNRLKIALLLSACGMILEFVGGLVSNSLALISDSGHMLTHLFALGMSYFAILLSLRPVTKKRTYGFYRAEVLAAFINGIALLFVCAYLIYEAIMRFLAPQPIQIGQMLLVAAIGLAINGVTTFLLAAVSRHDLNIRSAMLHEIGDMVSSIAVVGSGIAIYFSRQYVIDPILSLFICLLIIVWAVKLLIDSANILLEATPKHLDIDEVISAIKSAVPGVFEVHHIHAWTISSSMFALTAHVVIEDCNVSSANEMIRKINTILKERFHIEHTNIQFECLIKKVT